MYSAAGGGVGTLGGTWNLPSSCFQCLLIFMGSLRDQKTPSGGTFPSSPGVVVRFLGYIELLEGITDGSFFLLITLSDIGAVIRRL